MTVVEFVTNSMRPFWFRGKMRLLNGICPRVGIRKCTLFGYNVELDLSDHIQRNVYLGTYEPQDSRLVQRYLSPGNTFVDVGANFGYYSLMAASVVGNSGRVIGFEPNPELCDHLRGTIEKNKIVNVTVEQAGVSDQAGHADLFLPIEHGNNTATMVPNRGGRRFACRWLLWTNILIALGSYRLISLKLTWTALNRGSSVAYRQRSRQNGSRPSFASSAASGYAQPVRRPGTITTN